MRAWAWLVRQEAIAERRAPERLPVLVLFAGVLLVTLRFTLPSDAGAWRGTAAAGYLWASVVFASLLELRRSAEADRRSGAIDALRLAPVDASVVFAAKLAAALAVVAVVDLLLVGAAAFAFSGRASGVVAAWGVLVLGSVGLLSWGVLFSAATAQTRSAEAVVAVLLFPLLVPQTIAVVRLVGHYLAGVPLDDPLSGFILLGAFDVLSLGTGALLFEYVLEE